MRILRNILVTFIIAIIVVGGLFQASITHFLNLPTSEKISFITKTAFENRAIWVLEHGSRLLRDHPMVSVQGYNYLSDFYGAIQDVVRDGKPRTEEDWKRNESIADEWLKEYPSSPSPHIVRAGIDREHAWYYRGNGYADTITADGSRIFNEYMQRSAERLWAIKPVADKDPAWYSGFISVIGANGGDNAEMMEIYREGVKKFPSYVPIYEMTLNYLLPQWGGSYALMEAFAQDAANNTQKIFGDGLYTKLYLQIADSSAGNDLFIESDVKWPHMKKGFDDWLARFPNHETTQLYGKYACLAGDKGTAAQILPRLGKPDESVWRKPVMIFYLCGEWAGLPKAKARPDIPLENLMEGKGWEQWTNTLQNSAEAFLFDNYDKLDKMAEYYRAGDLRFPHGFPRLQAYYMGIEGAISSNFFGGNHYWNFMQQKINAWKAARPASITAMLADAALPHIQAAHMFPRRAETLAQLPVAKRLAAASLLNEANRRLDAIKDEAKSDPDWYAQKLIISHMGDWDKAAAEPLVDESIRAFPRWPQIYYYALQAMLPFWEEDLAGNLDDFARRPAAFLPRDEAAMLYAMIYVSFSNHHGGANLFEITKPDWNEMKKGFEVLIEKYPDPQNINQYARFACLAGDKGTTSELLAKVGDKPWLGVWENTSLYTRCKQWASHE